MPSSIEFPLTEVSAEEFLKANIDEIKMAKHFI
jgi:hypothetical protein